jgi:hypothetical protein
MNSIQQIRNRALLLVAAIVALSLGSTQMRADTGTCNGEMITLPFTDVASSSFFCSIAAAYFSGLTDGTSDTTFNPGQNVKRDEVADFVSRTLDQSLRRGGNRAALNQWWTPKGIASTATTQVGNHPEGVQSDGADLWVASISSATVSRVRASDGRLLGTWTGAVGASAVLVARGRIFVLGRTSPGRLYSIDPTQPPGPVTLLSDDLGDGSGEIAYDGSRIWTANPLNGSVSIYKFVCINGVCVTTHTTGFNTPYGILYDGSNIWVIDFDGLKKLESNGSIAQSIPILNPNRPIFDGTNIWVPGVSPDGEFVKVVRVKDSVGNPLAQPFVIATLTGNGLSGPFKTAFDGQRILVTNFWGNSVSLWRATDLTPLGSFTTGSNSRPLGACSDGINFWIALSGTDRLARF